MTLRDSPAGRRPPVGGDLVGRARLARLVSRSAVGVVACAASVAAVGSPTVLAASMALTPAKDSFAGKITAATGKFSGDRGAVTIVLAPGAGQAARHLSVTIKGTVCARKVACVPLAGKLTGTLAPGPRTNPDVGRRFTIAATGTVKPLGHVSATGTVQGTGFINNGHESLTLKLTRPGGTVTIAATSGPVPGFTSP